MKKVKKVLSVIFCLVLTFATMNTVISPQTVQAATTWDTQSDTWVATDELGRTLPTYATVGPTRTAKYVGMFYHLWQHDVMYNDGSHDPGAPRDNTSILTNNPGALNNSSTPPWGPYGSYDYCYQPLLGYYNPEVDDYVIRRNAQMLSDAGVDTLIFDFTNFWASGVDNENYYNWNAFKKLADTYESIRSAGGKTPQFVFMCTWSGTNSANAVTRLYNDIYSKNLYSDLWFQWGGKPLIIADPTNCSSTIQNFFTFRTGHPEYTAPEKANDWPWLSIYPQSPAYTATDANEEVAVGTAQNWSTGLTFMSAQDVNGNFIARGRSYHNGSEPLYNDPLSASYSSQYGYNFQEGLDKALDINPDFLFVTGWNEELAARFSYNIFGNGDRFPAGGLFCDNYTPEFSRDIEPTLSGGLGDNYYMQLSAAIRKFKGVSTPPSVSAPTTITIDGNFSDWTNVQPEFRDDAGDTASRNCAGNGNGLTYTNATGRNDFKLMKVARDSTNLYFYVQTANNITSYTDPNWMRLFIKTNGTDPNWEGYNYIINRTGITSTKTTLEKSTGGWNWTTIDSNISYCVSGNQMEIAIPRSDLGIGSSVDIQFKWHDNMQTQGNVYDFYTNGDAAPNERYNYHYTDSAPTATFTWNTYNRIGSAYALQITSSQTPAMKFTADYSFNAVEASCPSYGNNIGNLTMTLYKWNTDYNTTVAGNPIATNTFINFADNAWLKLNFSKQAPGDYLWVLNNPAETVGIWKYESSNNPAVSYLNGTTTAGDFVSRIDYQIDSQDIEVNDNDAGITYSAMNYLNSATGYISNDCHYSNNTNAYAQYTFTGTSISWIGTRNTDHGKANVYIDGVLDSTVDTYGSYALQQVLYQKTGLTNASHTIKIVVTNTKNASSSGYFQDIDAFRYH